MPERTRVLFLCAHNSARSILAEFLVNHLRGDRFAAQSAGLEASGVNPYAVRVLQEIGINASRARSKSIAEFRGQDFDLVVTLCAPAEGACPAWLGKGRLAHLAFDDPARVQGTEEEKLEAFRAVRDEMQVRLFALLDAQRMGQ